MKRTIAAILFFSIANVLPAAAQELRFSVPDNISRGEPFVVDIFAANGISAFKVDWEDKTVIFPAACDENGCSASVMLPAKYEQYGDMPIFVSCISSSPDKIENNAIVGLSKIISIKDKAYSKQALKVDPRFVTLSKEDLARVEKESVAIRKTINTYSEKRFWDAAFVRPAIGAVSGSYGVEREFNGEPRNKHNGMDISGRKGDKIYAIADGTVIMNCDHFFSGRSIYIDHGQGVISMYFHLSKSLVNTGDTVKAGEEIGLIGATGRVTGPHLHLGLAVQGVVVDPSVLFSRHVSSR